MMEPALSLNPAELADQFRVVVIAVYSVVDAAVAGRTEPNDEMGIVRPAVAETTSVMRLDVGRPVAPSKWSICLATFTAIASSPQHIVPHIAATLIDRAHALHGIGRSCGSKRALPKVTQKRRLIGRVINLFIDGIDRYQFENNRVSNLSGPVGVWLDLIAFTNHLIHKSQSADYGLKEQNSLSVDGMISEGTVGANQLHGAPLAMAEIIESAVFPSVIVTVLLAFSAGDYNDHRIPSRGDHATLLLAAKPPMDVGPPVVHPSTFKTPAHPRSSPNLKGSLLQ